MSDFKEMISDTIQNLVGKAKELAGSDAVTGLVDKVISLIPKKGDKAEKSAEVVEDTAEEA